MPCWALSHPNYLPMVPSLNTLSEKSRTKFSVCEFPRCTLKPQQHARHLGLLGAEFAFRVRTLCCPHWVAEPGAWGWSCLAIPPVPAGGVIGESPGECGEDSFLYRVQQLAFRSPCASARLRPAAIQTAALSYWELYDHSALMTRMCKVPLFACPYAPEACSPELTRSAACLSR